MRRKHKSFDDIYNEIINSYNPLVIRALIARAKHNGVI
jgi:hypothetical protein